MAKKSKKTDDAIEKLEPEPEQQPESEPEPGPWPEPGPEPGPEPEPGPWPEPGPEPGPEPDEEIMLPLEGEEKPEAAEEVPEPEPVEEAPEAEEEPSEDIMLPLEGEEKPEAAEERVRPADELAEEAEEKPEEEMLLEELESGPEPEEEPEEEPAGEFKSEIFTLRTTANREEQVLDFLGSNAAKKGLEVFSAIHPHGMRGYIFVEAASRSDAEQAAFRVPYARGLLSHTLDYKEIEHMLEKSKKVEMNIRKNDIAEIISGPFKREKCKVSRIDKGKEEVVVELLEAAVPIPITLKMDAIKVIRRDTEEAK